MKTAPRPQVYWRATGSGPVLVLLNGWTASGLAWPRAWVRQLERRYRLLRVDNRGSGYSRFCDTPFTVADMADDVAAVLDAEGHERAALVGLSMGGMIAQEFALRHSSRLQALMLISTRPPAPAHIPPPRLMALSGLLAPQRGGEGLDSYMTRLWSSAVADGFADREPRSIQDLVDQIVARPTTREMLMHQLRAVSGWGHADRLSRIDARTIVVHGDADTFVEAENGRRLAELIPGARYVELGGVGHLPPVESPEALLALVDELTVSRSTEADANGRHDARRVPSASTSWR